MAVSVEKFASSESPYNIISGSVVGSFTIYNAPSGASNTSTPYAIKDVTDSTSMAALTTAAARRGCSCAIASPMYFTTRSPMRKDNNLLTLEQNPITIPSTPNPATPNRFAVTMLKTALMALLTNR